MHLLKKKIDQYWRIVATGLSFAIFGIGGLILTIFCFPIISFLSRSEEIRVDRTQKVIHHTFRFFFWIMISLGLFDVRIEGKEKLKEGPFLILSNHPTLLDFVLIVSLMPRVDAIFKEDMLKSIFCRGVIRNARYLSNQDPQKLLGECVQRLNRRHSVLLFPEGTRSFHQEMRKFQRGAARIALRSGCRILPIILSCDPPTLQKHLKWYQVPPRKSVYRLRVCEPLDFEPIVADCRNRWISARKLTTYLQDYFKGQIAHAPIQAHVQSREVRPATGARNQEIHH